MKPASDTFTPPDNRHEWICTFGFGQTHPQTGEPLDNCYTRVRAATMEGVIYRMRSRFGDKWCRPYETEEAAGVVKYGLREVPFPEKEPRS